MIHAEVLHEIALHESLTALALYGLVVAVLFLIAYIFFRR